MQVVGLRAKAVLSDARLDRSQTIMQGASHCNFRYRMAEKGAE